MNRTTTLLLAVVVVVAAVPAVATAGTTQSDLVTLTVTVENEAGMAVGGAELTATWDDGNRTATTASNGQALIDVPQGADVDISVQSDEYVRNTPYEVDSVGQESVTITVAEKGTAEVQVRDGNGVPVNNAVVQLFHDGETVVNARTNSNGVHQSGTIEQGEYTLRAFKSGYESNGTTFDVDGDVSITTRIQTGSVIATFEVRDDHFDPAEPVEGASISIPAIPTSTTTLADGEATASVPVNSDLEVRITKDGYETVNETLEVGERDTSLDATIRKTEALNMAISDAQILANGSIRITLTNEYGTPQEGVPVMLDGEQVGETDESGELEVRIADPGEHTISAESEGLSDSSTVEAVRPGGPTPEDTATEVETTDDESTTSSGIGPGFTPVAAVVAALLAVLVLRRRA
ncbi:carboxypeptidase-like regulatory domain-containing protein [Halorientalis pallida]|uniref:Carboxypeptidase regulatory-like domain-containing protein n=1 Tax=Halorientalis pallida TaxID=2479928 RepID=A0A498KWT7_9EURY|nr:carboxypeptidase-like regulatory domain-containing protein [Halorientalis pallida]RXK46369.1 carboxypeptidase regulatory-like domain-containing protein [Halorientalis pallida]